MKCAHEKTVEVEGNEYCSECYNAGAMVVLKIQGELHKIMEVAKGKMVCVCGKQMHGYHGDWSELKKYKTPPLYKDENGNHVLWKMVCPSGHIAYARVR